MILPLIAILAVCSNGIVGTINTSIRISIKYDREGNGCSQPEHGSMKQYAYTRMERRQRKTDTSEEKTQARIISHNHI